MNIEQTIKALECCHINQSCDKCPMYEGEPGTDCIDLVMQSALTFIKEQRLEIDRLNKEVSDAVANTAEKMQTKIKEACIDGGIWPAFVAKVVEKTSKAILEEATNG